MGAHSNGPAEVAGKGTKLSDWIKAYPECLGKTVLDRFGPELPFLFKVSGRGD